jgi:chromosome partitioning protein
MTTILTVANQKGGVGKTTTAINLGHGLALKGKKVLILDFDSQGNVASSLGLRQEMGIYYLLTMGRQSEQEKQFVLQLVRPTGRNNLWVIPGNRDTVAAQMDMSSRERSISYVRQALGIFVGNGLDYIVIDTSPSLGGLQERALWAADWVIIPTAMEYLSNKGVAALIETLKSLRENFEWQGGLLGVLPTFYDNTTKQSQASLNNLGCVLAGQLLPVIHRATVQREAMAEAKTIYEKAPKCRTAREYLGLVDAVLRIRKG